MFYFNHRFAILFGTSVFGILVFGILWKKKKKTLTASTGTKGNSKPPVRWKRVAEISHLMMYPIKSAKAIHLESARCASQGLIDIENPNMHLRDREFIVYDPEKRKAVSGLVNTKITQLECTSVDKTTIRLSFPGMDDFYLKLPFDETKLVNLDRWWGEVVAAVDCGDDVARWLSMAILGQAPTGLRLGYFSQTSVPLRTVNNGWTNFAQVYTRLCDEYLGAYSYMASYLIISESSVDDLNRRLDTPITVSHFRANIVVRGCEPYSEDSWDWIKIGDDVIMRGFKPCTRCVIIAIDPATGVMDPHFEPLRTLKKYRQVTNPGEMELAGKGSEPAFGLYAGLHSDGTVKIGDPVYIGINNQ